MAQTGASEAGWKALSTSSGNLGASRVGYEEEPQGRYTEFVSPGRGLSLRLGRGR